MKFNPAVFGRHVFNGLAAASLLMAAVTLVMYWRSYDKIDFFKIEIPPRGVHTLQSNGGILELTIRWQPADWKPVQLKLSREVLHGTPFGGWGPDFAYLPVLPAGQWDTWKRLRVPYWPLLLALGVLPMAWLVRTVANSTFYKEGCCQTCGYDLRAATDRCPECGSEIPAPVQKPGDAAAAPNDSSG